MPEFDAFQILLRLGMFSSSSSKPKRGRLKLVRDRRGTKRPAKILTRGGSLMLSSSEGPRLVPAATTKDAAWDQFVYIWEHVDKAPENCFCPECLLFWQVADLLLKRFIDSTPRPPESQPATPLPGLLEQVIATEDYLASE